MRAKKKIIYFSIFILLYTLNYQTAWPAPFTKAEAIKELEGIAQPTEPPVVIEVPKVEYSAENLRDPFRTNLPQEQTSERGPGTEGALPLPALNIQGIVWGGKLPQAIINNQVVKVGDTVEGVRIIDINKKGITLLFNGQQHLLSSPAANMLQSQERNPQGGLR